MKIVDRLREKIGDDKLLHFLVYGFVVSIVSMFGYAPIAFFAMLILSAIKECLDATFNTSDLLAGILGGCVSLLTFYLSAL